MALPVDLSQNDVLNLQVLQRQDNQISDIIGTASHVVAYEFDQVEQSWVCWLDSRLFLNFSF